jgi:hypothetical protein
LVLYDILSDATKVQWLDTIPAFTWIGWENAENIEIVSNPVKIWTEYFISRNLIIVSELQAWSL